jgi:pyridoxal phosphate enzyme (YggS family)
MTTIAARLQAVNQRIEAAARAAGRQPGDVGLVAVSKTFPPSAIAEAHAAGQRAFGENYLQEALEKMRDLASPGRSGGAGSPEGGLPRPMEWHFIGPIQSNKTRSIAENFAWVHGVDRQKIAERLAQARPTDMPPLQVCMQVNVSGEPSKSGVTPQQAVALAESIAQLPSLRLRGLMAIPEVTSDPQLQRRRFRAVRELRDEIARHGIGLDTLSMGMSADLEAAIAEGATLVRIGTAIFGSRSAILPT